VGVFYLCLHTVGLVRMEVVWVCFICVYIPWVWLGWRWCGCVLFVFTYRGFSKDGGGVGVLYLCLHTGTNKTHPHHLHPNQTHGM
jgi:hypothetical protein